VIRLGQQEVIFRRFGSAVHGPGGKPLDVKSTTRPTKAVPAAAAVEVDDEAEVTEEERAGPVPATVAPKPRPSGTPSGKAPGLRGFLQLPPPPEPNGETAPAAAARSSAGGAAVGRTGSSGASRSRGGQRRRRNKKKRKR